MEKPKTMKKCYGFAAAFTLCVMSVAIPVRAEVFTRDGYDVDVQWNYKKKDQKIKAWATVKGGEPCSALNATLMLTDGKQSVSFESTVMDYRPSAEGTELAPQSQQVKKGKGKEWRPYQVKVECS